MNHRGIPPWPSSRPESCWRAKRTLTQCQSCDDSDLTSQWGHGQIHPENSVETYHSLGCVNLHELKWKPAILRQTEGASMIFHGRTDPQLYRGTFDDWGITYHGVKTHTQTHNNIYIYIVKKKTVADIPQQSINPTMTRNPCAEKAWECKGNNIALNGRFSCKSWFLGKSQKFTNMNFPESNSHHSRLRPPWGPSTILVPDCSLVQH